MVNESYIPERGDVVRINFNPQKGREQAGHRRAVVLSPRNYNGKVGLAVICPITTKPKGYSYEVGIPYGLDTRGAILADHLKSQDWKKRGAQFIERLPEPIIEAVLSRIRGLIGTQNPNPAGRRPNL